MSKYLNFIFLIAFPLNLWAQGKVILFIGDSLTEGYGVEKENSYPSLVQKKLDQKHSDLKYEVLNGSISGSTSASVMSRLKWFKKKKTEILVLALGANDGLRGIKPEETKKNLKEAIQAAKHEGMKILLLGMQMPPNYGADYRKQFEKTYQDLIKEEKVPYVPFLLEGIAGDKALNQSDGIHPNEKGHQLMADKVFIELEKML